MVFFVVHELRNGKGSCFSVLNFSNDFFSPVSSRCLLTIFLLYQWTPALSLNRVFLFHLQACIVWSLYNVCKTQRGKKEYLIRCNIHGKRKPIQNGNPIKRPVVWTSSRADVDVHRARIQEMASKCELINLMLCTYQNDRWELQEMRFFSSLFTTNLHPC